MKRHGLHLRLGLLMALILCLLAQLPVRAGDADHEIEDGEENGAPYFGEAKDVAGLKPLGSVRVKAQLKGSMRFMLGQTDDEGRFKLRGLGPDVDAEQVEVSCEKAGYRIVDASRRRLAKTQNAPVEVECLMEKGAAAKPAP